jgi:hypothetical protein
MGRAGGKGAGESGTPGEARVSRKYRNRKGYSPESQGVIFFVVASIKR